MPSSVQHPDQALLPGVTSNVPVHTLRHRTLKVAIWRNRSEKGPMHSVTLSRSYRDGNVWKESRSFSDNEIMNLAKLLFDAHTFIMGLRAKEPKKERPVAKLSSPPRSRRSEKSVQ
jgi:hypothetical protein